MDHDWTPTYVWAQGGTTLTTKRDIERRRWTLSIRKEVLREHYERGILLVLSTLLSPLLPPSSIFGTYIYEALI